MASHSTTKTTKLQELSLSPPPESFPRLSASAASSCCWEPLQMCPSCLIIVPLLAKVPGGSSAFLGAIRPNEGAQTGHQLPWIPNYFSRSQMSLPGPMQSLKEHL